MKVFPAKYNKIRGLAEPYLNLAKINLIKVPLFLLQATNRRKTHLNRGWLGFSKNGTRFFYKHNAYKHIETQI